MYLRVGDDQVRARRAAVARILSEHARDDLWVRVGVVAASGRAAERVRLLLLPKGLTRFAGVGQPERNTAGYELS